MKNKTKSRSVSKHKDFQIYAGKKYFKHILCVERNVSFMMTRSASFLFIFKCHKNNDSFSCFNVNNDKSKFLQNILTTLLKDEEGIKM